MLGFFLSCFFASDLLWCFEGVNGCDDVLRNFHGTECVCFWGTNLHPPLDDLNFFWGELLFAFGRHVHVIFHRQVHVGDHGAALCISWNQAVGLLTTINESSVAVHAQTAFLLGLTVAGNALLLQNGMNNVGVEDGINDHFCRGCLFIELPWRFVEWVAVGDLPTVMACAHHHGSR